jgi:alpha/beta superfamily hydrolase
MPEVIFAGPEGRLEGRYHHSETPRAPIAIILHPHPQHGGTMNNKVVYNLYYIFVRKGFSVLRFNFRGVGRSQGDFDNGLGELSDAASALDWLQSVNPNAAACWVAGFSFGAWISMQLLMRRPEIEGFISIAPPANMYDFSFLAPCPSSGLILQGTEDDVVPEPVVEKLANKLKLQKNIVIDYHLVKGANHFYKDHMDHLVGDVSTYLDMRMSAGTSKRKAAG